MLAAGAGLRRTDSFQHCMVVDCVQVREASVRWGHQAHLCRGSRSSAQGGRSRIPVISPNA